MRIIEVIDQLTFANYKHNRSLSPDVTVEQWAKIYGPQAFTFERKLACEQPSADETWEYVWRDQYDDGEDAEGNVEL